MSSQQRADEDRLLEAISERVDGVVTAFVVVAEYMNEDGNRAIFGCTLTDQPAHTSLGLIRWADITEQESIQRWQRRIDDDEDD